MPGLIELMRMFFEEFVQRVEVVGQRLQRARPQLIGFPLCAAPDSSSFLERLARHAEKVGFHESVVGLA